MGILYRSFGLIIYPAIAEAVASNFLWLLLLESWHNLLYHIDVKRLILMAFFLFSLVVYRVEAIETLWGTNLLIYLPGLSGQVWFSKNIGADVSAWPYLQLYETNVLYKVNNESIKPILGMGYMFNEGFLGSKPSSMIIFKLGLEYKWGEITVIPALTTTSAGFPLGLATFGFYWPINP